MSRLVKFSRSLLAMEFAGERGRAEGSEAATPPLATASVAAEPPTAEEDPVTGPSWFEKATRVETAALFEGGAAR